MKLEQIQEDRSNLGLLSTNTKKYNKPFLNKDKDTLTLKRKRGQRGNQKNSPSGHLAATIQIRNGVYYPRGHRYSGMAKSLNKIHEISHAPVSDWNMRLKCGFSGPAMAEHAGQVA